MDKHEEIIKSIKEEYRGIDYSKGKDLTVLCIYGIQAEDTIKALGKQIPKEFTLLNQDYGYFECSTCDHAINYGEDYTEHNYCLNCGQRLDWTEVVK